MKFRLGRDVIFHSEPFAWRRKRYREWLCGAVGHNFKSALVASVILLGAEATRECWAARTRAVASGFGGLKDPPRERWGR